MKAIGMAMFGLLIGANAFAQAPSAIAGEYIEARSGYVYTCGCLYSGEQVTTGGEAILAWSFRQGEFRGTPLAGVTAVAVVVGEGHLGIEGTPRKSILYLDSSGSNAQRQAALELLRSQYGKALGAILAVHTAPVAFQSDGDNRRVSVGDTVSIVARRARLPEDAHPGSSAWYGPFVPMTDSALSTTLYHKYGGQDFNRQWWGWEPGITGYMGSFVLTR